MPIFSQPVRSDIRKRVPIYVGIYVLFREYDGRAGNWLVVCGSQAVDFSANFVALNKFQFIPKL